MKKTIVISFLIALNSVFSAARTSEMDRFISRLMSRMTIEEKLGQLNMVAVRSDIVTGPEVNADLKALLRADALGSVLNTRGAENVRELQRFAVDSSSLHIPLLFGLDVIHGYGVQMPVPLAIAATWDPSAAQETARLCAEAMSSEGICWTFAPMVDITHDARWGRIVEGSGEDPYLGSLFAQAYVRGFQGDGSWAPDQVMACIKHFALYGAPAGGLDYTAVDMSRTHAWNYYMAPYKAAVDAGAASVMTAFNEFEGVPGTANKYLLKDVLRGQWGYKGIVVSDYNAVVELTEHGLGGRAEAARMAAEAGLDIDMCSGLFLRELPDLVKEGKVSRKTIDAACRRVLEMKYKLGLFADPYRYCRPEGRAENYDTPKQREASCRIAGESFVLLKNEGGVLPLKRDAKVALVGPYAVECTNMEGPWSSGNGRVGVVSLREGLEKFSSSPVAAEAGCDFYSDAVLQKYVCWYRKTARLEGSPEENADRAVAAVSDADVIIAAMGEPAQASGEGASLTDISIPDVQKELLERLVATGKPVVLVLFNGRPLDLSWESANVAAILDVWFPGSEAGNAIAKVLYGEVNPSGKLPVSFPRSVGQLPYYYNHTMPARKVAEGSFLRCRTRYLDSEISPLYPFGFGLSYTEFEYADPVAEVRDGRVTIKVDVRNAGAVSGSETVQLYIRDVEASESRPVCSLKGFRKVRLAPGQTETVEFSLGKEDLSFYNARMNFVFEPGKFLAMTGGNCRDVKKVQFIL